MALSGHKNANVNTCGFGKLEPNQAGFKALLAEFSRAKWTE